MGSPFPIAFLMGPLIIFQCLTASLIGQSVSFALPAVMGGTGIALLSQFTLNLQATMDTMLPSLRLEEPSSGQSHNLLN